MQSVRLTDGKTDFINTPILYYDLDQGLIEIVGRCCTENINTIIIQAFSIMDKCLRKGKLHLSFKFDYYGTHDSYLILETHQKLYEHLNKGANIKCYWHYKEGDDDMEEAGEDFADLTDLPIEFVKY